MHSWRGRVLGVVLLRLHGEAGVSVHVACRPSGRSAVVQLCQQTPECVCDSDEQNVFVTCRYALFGILSGSVWGYLAVVALVRRYMRKRFYQARLWNPRPPRDPSPDPDSNPSWLTSKWCRC